MGGLPAPGGGGWCVVGGCLLPGDVVSGRVGGCVSAPRGVCSWGGLLPRGVRAWSGGSALGGLHAWSGGGAAWSGRGGVWLGGLPQCLLGYPPCEQNDKQVQKYYLGHNFVAAGNKQQEEKFVLNVISGGSLGSRREDATWILYCTTSIPSNHWKTGVNGV